MKQLKTDSKAPYDKSSYHPWFYEKAEEVELDKTVEQITKEEKEKLKDRISNYREIKKMNNPIVNLIAGVAALIVAFLFVFIMPGAGFEELVITFAAGVFAQLKFVGFRTKYDLAKGWMKSKTIIGALMVVIPLIVLSLINFFIPAVAPAWLGWLIMGLKWLITLGLGTTGKGIYDVLAVQKSKQLEQNKEY